MLVQPAPPKVAAEIAEFVRWLGLQSGKVAKTVSPSTVRNYASYTRRLLVIVRDEALTYENVKEMAVRETSARGNKTSTWNVWTDSVRAYDRFRQTRCKDETHRALAVRGAKGWNPVECKRGKHGFSLLMVREARTDTEHHKKVTREMLDALIEAARRANDTVFERFLLTAWSTMARGGEQRSDIGEISAAELLMLKVKDFNFAGTFEYPDVEGEVVLRYGGKTGKGQKAWFWYPGDAAAVKASFVAAGLGPDDFAFPGVPNEAMRENFRGHLRYHTVMRRMKAYCLAARIERRSIHGIRGGAASWLDRAHVPIADIMTLGRWGDPVTLKNYLESTKEGMGESLREVKKVALATAPVVVEEPVVAAPKTSLADEARELKTMGFTNAEIVAMLSTQRRTA